jgi:hypothetical protein
MWTCAIRRFIIGERALLSNILLFKFVTLLETWAHFVCRLYNQPWMIDGYAAARGMRSGRGNRSTRRKPAPVPLFSTKPTWPDQGLLRSWHRHNYLFISRLYDPIMTLTSFKTDAHRALIFSPSCSFLAVLNHSPSLSAFIILVFPFSSILYLWLHFYNLPQSHLFDPF